MESPQLESKRAHFDSSNHERLASLSRVSRVGEDTARLDQRLESKRIQADSSIQESLARLSQFARLERRQLNTERVHFDSLIQESIASLSRIARGGEDTDTARLEQQQESTPQLDDKAAKAIRRQTDTLKVWGLDALGGLWSSLSPSLSRTTLRTLVRLGEIILGKCIAWFMLLTTGLLTVPAMPDILGLPKDRPWLAQLATKIAHPRNDAHESIARSKTPEAAQTQDSHRFEQQIAKKHNDFATRTEVPIRNEKRQTPEADTMRQNARAAVQGSQEDYSGDDDEDGEEFADLSIEEIIEELTECIGCLIELGPTLMRSLANTDSQPVHARPEKGLTSSLQPFHALPKPEDTVAAFAAGCRPQALQPAAYSYSYAPMYPEYSYGQTMAPMSGGQPVTSSMGHQMVPQALPLPTMGSNASQPPPAFRTQSQHPFDTTGQIAPHGMKPSVTATLWEDEGSLCFQVEANGVCVARREDNHMINGTKLLNVAGMTRGRRDSVLKSEKTRHIVKIGPMHLKGIWIPFDRALDFANKMKITEMLYPLFVHNVGALLYHPTNQARHSIANAATAARQPGQGQEDRPQDTSRTEPLTPLPSGDPTPAFPEPHLTSDAAPSDSDYGGYTSKRRRRPDNDSGSASVYDPSALKTGVQVDEPPSQPAYGTKQELRFFNTTNPAELRDLHQLRLDRQHVMQNFLDKERQKPSGQREPRSDAAVAESERQRSKPWTPPPRADRRRLEEVSLDSIQKKEDEDPTSKPTPFTAGVPKRHSPTLEQLEASDEDYEALYGGKTSQGMSTARSKSQSQKPRKYEPGVGGVLRDINDFLS